MRVGEISPILECWNDGWFRAIEEKVGVSLTTPSRAMRSDAVRLANIKEDDRCCCGDFNGNDLFPEEIKHSQTQQSLAVGAVLDADSEDRDLPLIVAVGINYWQFGGNSQPWAADNWRTTRMRPRLDAAMKSLSGRGCWEGEPPAMYHLVAVNFFPWVTRAPWSQLPNSLMEALAFHCWGLPGAPERIGRLADTLQASVIAFHGVNNAVPLLALRTVGALRSEAVVVFTDNLAYPTRPKNAAILRTRI